MGQITLAGNPPIEVALRRSRQAKRLSLRLSRLDGRVTLTMPRAVSIRDARAFVSEKEAWLRQHLAQQPATVPVTHGALVPVHGVPRQVVAGQGRSVELGPETLLVPGDPDRVAGRLRGWLKAQARDALAEASDRHAARLGVGYNRLTLRDTRSRWGSCTADGGLMYSWRLILAPPEVLDYVAAHEVAHLREMNHSPAFWDLVTRLYGDWRASRAWLRDEGTALHRYVFGD